MSSLSSLNGNFSSQTYLLVSRNGTSYKYSPYTGKYGSTSAHGGLIFKFQYDDLFLVSRNDVKYKIKWMDLYGVVPDSWETTVNNTISGTFNTDIRDVFYKLDMISSKVTTWTYNFEDFHVCHDGTYAYTSIDNGATWTKIDGNNPDGNSSYSSIHPISGGHWNHLYSDPSLDSGYVFLVGTDGKIKFNDTQIDAFDKYMAGCNGSYTCWLYETKHFCAQWRDVFPTGTSREIFQIVGNGNRDFMYGSEDARVGFSTDGDHTEYRTSFTGLKLYSSWTQNPDISAVAYDYDNNYWLAGTSNSSLYGGRIAYAQDPGGHVMPLNTSDWSDVNLQMDNVTHIACGNGVWVGVGNGSGTIKIETSSSSSPSTWANVTLPASMSSSTGAGVFKFDQYAKRFFLGLKDSQKFFHSHDGVNWTENSPTAGNTNKGIFGCTWVPKKDSSAVVGDFLVVGAGRQGHRTTITNDVKLLQDSDYMIIDYKQSTNSKYYTYKFDGALWKSFVETDDTTY